QSLQQDPIINRQGVLNLEGSQEWKHYGGWLTRGTNFSPTVITARASNNIISTVMKSDHIEITLADRIDYVLSANASVLAVDSATGELGEGGISVRPVFDRKIYQTVDSEGRTVVHLYFVADLTVKANMITQAIDTTVQGSSLASNLSAVWGTGTVTITHP